MSAIVGESDDRAREAVTAAAVFKKARRENTALLGMPFAFGCAQFVTHVRFEVETPLLTDERPRQVAIGVDEIKAMFFDDGSHVRREGVDTVNKIVRG